MEVNNIMGWNKNKTSLALMLGLLLIVSVLASACSTKETLYTQAEVDTEKSKAYGTGYDDGTADVDITSDNQKAIDAYIESLPEVEVEEETEATVTVEVVEVSAGPLYTSEYSLGESVDLSLDDNEVSKLFDGEVDFDGSSTDVKETVVLTSDAQFAYSGSSDYDEEFATEAYLVGLVRGAIKYTLSIEDSVSLADISEETPLVVDFLGRELTITDAESGEISFFAKPSQYIQVGASQEVDGKTLTLIDAGWDSVIVEVDGTIEVINVGSTETVEGVKVYVESTFTRAQKEDSSAVLVFGEGSKQTVADGDYYDEAEQWVWDIEDDGTDLLSVALVLDEKFNRLDSDVKALAVGDCIKLPEDYLSICFEKTNEPEYSKLSVSFDTIDVAGVDHLVTEVSTDEDVLELDGENVKAVYSDGTSIYYKEGNDYVVASDSSVNIDLSDADYTLSFGSLGEVYLLDEDGFYITIVSDATGQKLGTLADEAEAGDVLYDGYPVGSKEESVLTGFGVKIKDPEDNADQDEVELWLPDEKLELTLGVY